MSINLHFLADDWDRIQRDWTAWWHLETDRPLTVINACARQGINFIPLFSGWDEDTVGFISPLKVTCVSPANWVARALCPD
jgi:hypothetical protein